MPGDHGECGDPPSLEISTVGELMHVTFSVEQGVREHIYYHGEYGGPVRDYMSEGVQTVNAEMSIVDLAEVFIDKRYRRFPVTDKNRLVGQISRRDVLQAAHELMAIAKKRPETAPLYLSSLGEPNDARVR